MLGTGVPVVGAVGLDPLLELRQDRKFIYRRLDCSSIPHQLETGSQHIHTLVIGSIFQTALKSLGLRRELVADINSASPQFSGGTAPSEVLLRTNPFFRF